MPDVIHISLDGNDADDGRDWSHAKLTVTAALAAMGSSYGVVQLGIGTFDIGNGLSLAGKRCVLRGLGRGTVLHAMTQSGPVISLAGWLSPSDFLGMQIMGDFQVWGSGQPVPTNHGIDLGSGIGTAAGMLRLQNVGINYTGGSCLAAQDSMMCHLENVTCVTPIDAALNNVPYAKFRGAFNGNRIDRLGLYNGSAAPEPAACILIEDDGINTPSYNVFRDLWCEGLQPSIGTAIVSCRGNGNTFQDAIHFDTKTPPAAGTCFYRLLPSGAPGQNAGGNSIRGIIPGSRYFTTGVHLDQSRFNRIEGVKGAPGSNVILEPGTWGTCIDLGGVDQSDGSLPAVADNANEATNSWSDEFGRVWKSG